MGILHTKVFYFSVVLDCFLLHTPALNMSVVLDRKKGNLETAV